MYFRLLHDERSGAVSYLLGDLDAGEAMLVDPRGADVPVLSAMLDEHHLRLRWLLRTHEHDELLTGEATALDLLGAPRIQHHLPTPETTGESAAESAHAVLTFGNEHVQVLRTPGHTAGCLSYLWRDRLFRGGLLAADASAPGPAGGPMGQRRERRVQAPRRDAAVQGPRHALAHGVQRARTAALASLVRWCHARRIPGPGSHPARHKPCCNRIRPPGPPREPSR